MILRTDQVRIGVSGEYACFTRPEFKLERRSYDVMNPSAAEGVLEAVYWHPGARYQIDRILLMKPIRWDTITINELKMQSATKPLNVEKDRIQKTVTVLRDVGYVIEATVLAENRAEVMKAVNIFNRRQRLGQSYRTPYLGQSQFVARLHAIAPDKVVEPIPHSQDLGWMFHSRIWENGRATRMRFFPAHLIAGVLDATLTGEMIHAA